MMTIGDGLADGVGVKAVERTGVGGAAVCIREACCDAVAVGSTEVVEVGCRGDGTGAAQADTMKRTANTVSLVMAPASIIS
jgi:hypothetical protein